jgi:hypothetical protein
MIFMDIPITGFVMHSDDDNDKHSHKLFITSWGGRPVHTHEFNGVTSSNVAHNHRYAGVTEAAPNGVPHVHQYYTVTSFDAGHTHLIQGATGPAIPIPGGGHIHYFEGLTTVNGSIPHTHAYSGKTGS